MCDISCWNTSNVTDMGYIFYDATAFNQDLSGWKVSSVTNRDNIFTGATEMEKKKNKSKWPKFR